MSQADADTCRRQLRDIIHHGRDSLRQLAVILDSERGALEARDSDALNTQTATKQRYLAALEELEQKRVGCLADAGFAGDSGAMQACLDWCDTDSTLVADWQDYLALAARCSTVNGTNGAIIRARAQQIAAIMNVLAGGTTAPTYGPGGSRDATASRPLCSA